MRIETVQKRKTMLDIMILDIQDDKYLYSGRLRREPL